MYYVMDCDYIYEFLASLFNSDYDVLILKRISCKGLKEFVESFRVIVLCDGICE